MFKVSMKAMYGVEYVVNTYRTLKEAIKMYNYILGTNDEEYFDGLLVCKVAIEHINGMEIMSARV